MKYIVVIYPKTQRNNLRLLNSIITMGYKNVQEVYMDKLYSFSGDVGQIRIEQISKILLVDPIVEDFKIVREIQCSKDFTIINIWYKPEVLDVEALYISRSINYIGIKNDLEIHSGVSFKLKPKIEKEEAQLITEKLFMNPLIQYYEIK